MEPTTGFMTKLPAGWLPRNIWQNRVSHWPCTLCRYQKYWPLCWFLLHCMLARSSTRKLSACLSIKRVDCDKTEERSVQIFKPYERLFSLAFW